MESLRERRRAIGLFGGDVGLVCFALAFCLTVWFLRRPDQLLRPYIWVEEYKVLDSLQLHGLFRAALAPINGYFVWPTSFTVGLAAAVDFRNVPQIDYWMSTAWFLATLCLVLVPSSNFKLQWRVGFVLLLVLVPTNPEVFGIALYSFWWTTLWPLISVTWAKDNWWLRVPVLVLGGMSSLAGAAMALPYAVLYAKDRRRRDLVGAAVLGATCVAQAVAYFTSARSLQTPVLPLRVALQELRNFADYAFAWLNPTDTGFLGLAGACILLAFLWAVWPDILRRRSSCASELTALVVGLFVVGILSAVPVPLFTNPASAGPRYYFLPFVIFSWALLVIAMTSAVQWARVVAAVMIVASLLALSSDFSRHEDPVSWSAQLARCRTAVGTFSVPVQFTGVASQMWQGLLVITPQTCRRLGYKCAVSPRRRAYYRGVGIREVSKHGHPLVRLGVVVVAAFLVVLLFMTVVSVVVGMLWTLIKIALFVLLVAGLLHMWGRSRAASRSR